MSLGLTLNLGLRPIMPELEVSTLGLGAPQACLGILGPSIAPGAAGRAGSPGRKRTAFVSSNSGLSFNLGLGIKRYILLLGKISPFLFH